MRSCRCGAGRGTLAFLALFFHAADADRPRKVVVQITGEHLVRTKPAAYNGGAASSQTRRQSALTAAGQLQLRTSPSSWEEEEEYDEVENENDAADEGGGDSKHGQQEQKEHSEEIADSWTGKDETNKDTAEHGGVIMRMIRRLRREKQDLKARVDALEVELGKKEKELQMQKIEKATMEEKTTEEEEEQATHREAIEKGKFSLVKQLADKATELEGERLRREDLETSVQRLKQENIKLETMITHCRNQAMAGNAETLDNASFEPRLPETHKEVALEKDNHGKHSKEHVVVVTKEKEPNELLKECEAERHRLGHLLRTEVRNAQAAKGNNTGYFGQIREALYELGQSYFVHKEPIEAIRALVNKEEVEMDALLAQIVKGEKHQNPEEMFLGVWRAHTIVMKEHEHGFQREKEAMQNATHQLRAVQDKLELVNNAINADGQKMEKLKRIQTEVVDLEAHDHDHDHVGSIEKLKTSANGNISDSSNGGALEQAVHDFQEGTSEHQQKRRELENDLKNVQQALELHLAKMKKYESLLHKDKEKDEHLKQAQSYFDQFKEAVKHAKSMF